jgi:purine catabolism regulator
MQLQLTVEDLVQSPGLQLRVLAGSSGLQRHVSWAHVSELPDPTPWLLGGELLMTTGLAIPRSASAQRAYLLRLCNAGVAALALSAQLHVPPLSRMFLKTADEQSMPVVEVAISVPFIAISQEVAAALHSDMHRRLTAQLHVFGALRTLASEKLSVADLFRRLERLSGHRLYLCTATGQPLLPGVPVPRPELAALLPAGYDSPPSFPHGYVLPVPAPGGPAGFLVAEERDGVVSTGIAVVQHIATVAALQLAILRQEQETMRRQGAETLAELLQGVLDPTTAHRRLARLGFRPDELLRLALIRGGQTDDSMILQLLSHDQTPVLLLRQQNDVVALLADSALPALDRLVELGSPAVGVSRGFKPDEGMDIARREATWSAARSQDSGGGVIVYGEDPAGRWLAEDSATLTRLVRNVLGAALDYDQTHSSMLVPSVRSWLEHDRHGETAAKALQIHPNTLAYRLRRFEDLTGRSLNSTQDITEVWLSMRALMSHDRAAN